MSSGAAASERVAQRARAHALWAAALLMAALGVFHAWSVLVEPLQAELGLSRSAVSGVYSVATAVFAASMLLEPAIHRRLPTVTVAAGSALLAAGGLALAALPAPWALFLGYGGLFAVANGLGYGLALHIAATLGGRRAGTATGAMVACYAVGATALAPLLSVGARDAGVAATFAALAALMLAVAIAQTALLGRPAVAVPTPEAIASGRGDTAWGRDRTFWLLWAGFLGGSAAGLVVLAHAAAVVAWVGGGSFALSVAAALAAAGNGIGRLLAGVASDRIAVRRVLFIAAGVSAGALLGLAALPTVLVAMMAIGLGGTAYGALAGAYPIAAARYYGARRVTAAYARVFTAWGLAGLVAPVVAGGLFDATGGYVVALLAAGAVAALSAAASAALPASAEGR